MVALNGYYTFQEDGGNAPVEDLLNPHLSVDLAEYTDQGWPHALSLVSSSGETGLTDNTPITAVLAAMFTGGRARSYMDEFYYRIHVIPREIDIGNITQRIDEEIEVWNAWLTSQTLSAITEIGTSGMAISGKQPPAVYQPTESQIYALTILTSGAPTVNAIYTFDFAGAGMSPTLAVIGRRVITLPFAPDWAERFTETLSWLTTVLTSRDGKEQRVRKRSRPRRGYRYTVKPVRTEGPLLENLLYDWQSRLFGIPSWHQARTLVEDLTAGSTQIAIDARYADYEDGGMLMLWRNSRLFEALQVEAVTDSLLTLVRPTLQAWRAGDRIMPLQAGRLGSALQVNNLTIAAAVFEVNAEIDSNAALTATAPAVTYQGLPVIEKRPNSINGYQETWRRPLAETLDTRSGLVVVDDVAVRPHKLKTYSWLFKDRAAAWVFRENLAWLAGRFQVCWIPERSDDFQLIGSIAGASNSFLARSDGYADHVGLDEGRRDIMVLASDGTVHYRRLIDAVNNQDGTETFTFDSPLGTTYQQDEVRLISVLSPVRLDHDAIDLIYHTTEVMTVDANVRLMPA